MHRRFKGARLVELQCPGGTAEVVLAESFRLRLLGLMRLVPEEIEPLLFPHCWSIHMHGMRTVIDLVWLMNNDDSNQGRVIALVESLEPGRRARAPRDVAARRSVAALELPPGEAKRLGLTVGAELTVS